MSGYCYESMLRELERLPARAQIEALGTSLLGREIPMITLGEGEVAGLYVGAHHGSESITAAVLVDLLRELASFAKDRRVCEGVSAGFLLAHRRIIVIPMLNPDGVEYATNGIRRGNPLYERVLAMNGSAELLHWQANARGVDLNHNYNAGFAEYRQQELARGLLNGAPTGYSGEYPESEPETAALAALLRDTGQGIRGVLTLHTQGEEIFCGRPGAAPPRAEAICRLLERSTGYSRAEPVGSAAYGGLTDWCLSALRLPSFTLECGKGKNPLPIEQRHALYRRLRTALLSFPLWL